MSARKKDTTKNESGSAAVDEPQVSTPGGEAGSDLDAADVAARRDGALPSDGGSPQPVTLEDLEGQVASLEDQVLRAKADYQNLQRRSGTEQAEAVRFANAGLMRSLVGVVDDLERSLAAAEGSDGTATLRDGVRLAYENLMKALGDHGLEAIDALNEKFDPSVHNAIMQAATSEHLPGVVIEQVARGYRLRDRVLRAAMVIVSKAADDALGE